MQSSSIPGQFSLPFANSAGPSYITFPIPAPSQIAITDGAASLTDGFPPDTFIDIDAGGVPPSGKDVNGALKMLSQWAQWQGAGGPVFYDGTQSTAIGGYPKGATLMSTSFRNWWISTVDNNTSNPDAGGANWTAVSQFSSLAGSTRNLVGSSSGGVKTATYTCDQIAAAVSLAGITYLGTSLTLNFNGAGTGANGMDTGAFPASGNLYMYAIFNPTTGTWACLATVAGAGATIYGGVNLPPGYTASCLIGQYVISASNFLKFFQTDRRVTTAPNIAVVTGGTATSFTSVSLVTAVPLGAKTVFGWNTTGAGGFAMVIAADSGGTLGMLEFGTANTAGNNTPYEIALATAQTFWYSMLVGGNTTIYVTGYTF